MRKGFILIGIVLWVLIATIIVGVLIVGVNGGLTDMTGTGTLIKSEEIVLSNKQNIVVDGTYNAVEIRKTDGDSIKVHQYGSVGTTSEKLFLASTSGDTVRIYFENVWYLNIFNFNMNGKLVIEIPKDFQGNLNAKTSSGGVRIEDTFTLRDVDLQSSSGGVHVNNNLSANRFSASTLSGGVHIEGNIIAAEDVKVNSSSGGIQFNGTVTAKNLNAETSSGGIHSTMAITAHETVSLKSSSGGVHFDGAVTAKDLTATVSSGGMKFGTVNVEHYYLDSSSGGIKVESISGGGEAKTSSANLEISLKDPTGDIRLTSSSGEIKIKLESSLQFTLDAQTSSGGIRTNFATETNDKGNRATAKIGSNPTANIIVHASSGGISIEK